MALLSAPPPPPPPPPTTPAARTFLQACKQHDNLNVLVDHSDIRSRFIDYKQSWNKRREITCTYGLHMEHNQTATWHQSLSWFIFQKGDIPAMT